MPTRGQRLTVLIDGYVRLVDWMGDDLSVVNAARASFMKEATSFRAPDERLVAYLARHGHHSPFRHAVVSLEIKAPLMVARQWFKYRVGAAHTPDSAEMLGVPIPPELASALGWVGQGDDGGDGSGDLMQARNEASRRYVTLPPEFYIPDAKTGSPWRAKPENSKQGSSGTVAPEVDQEATARLTSLIAESIRHYDWALASGISAEQARLFLPAYALHTVWRWTASVQAVAHFISQRLGDDAQREIQAYARALTTLVTPLFPHALGTLVSR
jgi:thymidylate synthase (FAD)